MKVLVLLSSFNGELFISQQLDSILSQSIGDVSIRVRDDGSTDRTTEILDEYQEKGLLSWYSGEHKGPSKSYWHLLKNCPDADYYAFSDQDDVWDLDKLETAVTTLEKYDTDSPLLYCGDVRVTDRQLNIIRDHMCSCDGTDYMNFLLKKLAPGCTFVFNREAKETLGRYDEDQFGLDLHDWTACQIISCFGTVVFDPSAHMSYRQHDSNVIGDSKRQSFFGKAWSFLAGPMKNSRQMQAERLMKSFGFEMSPENRAFTESLSDYLTDPLARRLLLRKIAVFPNRRDAFLFRILIHCRLL